MARGRPEFNYTPDFDSTVRMAETRGGGYDSIVKDNVKVLKPRANTNEVRILPPTWANPKFYGLGIYVHYDVGPNNRQYLCLRENPTSPHRRCPVCDALYDLGSRATQEDRQRLRPKLSYLYYVIDRLAENEGVQVWRTSQKNMSEIAIQSIDRRNQSVLNITHLEDGYDVEFTRVGEGRNGTRYHGFMVMRQSTPLADTDRKYDDWTRYIVEHPLTEVLNFYSPEYIEQVLHGRAKDDDDDDDRGRTPSPRDGDGDGEYEAPRRLRRTREEEPEDEPPPRRARREEPEVDEEEPLPRRSRREEPEVDDEPPPRRRRAEPEVDEEPAPRRRRSVSEEIDDDIPFDTEEPAPRRRRERLNGDGEESPPRRARSDNGEDRHEAQRARARQALSRRSD